MASLQTETARSEKIPKIVQPYTGPLSETPHFTEVWERGTETMTQETNACLVNHTTNRKKQCEKAFEKLQKGTYGICEDCHKEINPERLEVVPEATLCISCQSKKENN